MKRNGKGAVMRKTGKRWDEKKCEMDGMRRDENGDGM
jgi:hypothetical protein